MFAAANLSELHDYLAELIKIAQEHYEGPADALRIPPPNIAPSDKVVLGPFKVIDCIGNNSVRFRLPYELRLIHPLFHIPQIEASVPNRFPGRQPPPPEPMEIDGEIEYAFRYWLTCELFYLV